MKKLAVIFPGIGYHSERPLLYYAKRLAKESGFDIVEVSYDNLPKENKLLAFQMAMEMAEKILEPILFETYDSILFISKSIGTEVASKYEERIEKRCIIYILHQLKSLYQFFIPKELYLQEHRIHG